MQDGPLDDFLTAWAEARPGAPALVTDGETVDWASFRTAVLIAADAALAAGIRPGMTAIVAGTPILEAWAAVLALRALGVTTIACAAPEALAGPQKALASAYVLLTGAKAPADPGGPVLRMPPDLRQRMRRPVDAPPRPLGARASHLLLSSGTTGRYKLIEMDAASEPASRAERARFYCLSPSSVFHNGAFGLWTAAGLRYPLAVWQAGGTVVTDQRADAFARYVEHGVTDGFVIPPLLERLLAAQGPERRRLEGVRLIVAGGFTPLPLVAEVRDRLTDRIRNVYSSTEPANVLLYRDLDGPLEEFHWLRTREGNEIEIVDDGGRPCPPGTEGELRYRPRIGDCTAYSGDPEATARVFRDGWFHPGDRAIRRDDGLIRITGRSDAVIVLSGHKVASAPIELDIRDALGVREVCLFTGPDATGREVIVVAIEADRRPERAALEQVVRQFSRHGRVVFSVRRLFPRTLNGMRKTIRHRLKAEILEELRAAAPKAAGR